MSFEPAWTVPADLLYIDGQTRRSWIPGAHPFPVDAKRLHWNNAVHLECIRRWFIDVDVLPAMAHLLDPTLGPIRAVYQSWGGDLDPEIGRTIAAQCVALAAVDADLGLPNGMSHPVVNCNVRHFANGKYAAVAKSSGAEHAGRARWMIWALYFQLRWDTPEYTVPLILDAAKPEGTASPAPSETSTESPSRDDGAAVPGGNAIPRRPQRTPVSKSRGRR